MKIIYKTKKLKTLICLLMSLICLSTITAAAAEMPEEIITGETGEEETIEDIYSRKDLDPFTDPEKFAEQFGLVSEGDFDPKSYDYFYYNRHFMITISEENVYDVTEIADVYIGSSSNGITRVLPRYNAVADLNGATTMGYPKYSGIYSDDPLNITYTEDNITVKIGDEKQGYHGFKQFRLHYTLDLGKDVVDGRDEAFMYLISPTDDKPTLRCQFEITMPKAFDEDRLLLFCTGDDKGDILTYSVEDMTIKGETTYHTNSGQYIVFRLKLDEGYFDKATRSYDTAALISLGATTLMVILCTILYLISRSRNGTVHRLDFFPPKELNPLQAAYLKTCKISDKKYPLLLPYLASRGCFKVTEFSKGTGKLDRSSCGFIYTKSDKQPMLTGDEKLFVNGMFGRRKKAADGEGISVHDNELRGSFYSTIEQIKNYIKTDKTSPYSTYFSKGGAHMRLIYRVVLYLLASIGIGIPISFMGTGENEYFSFITFVLTGFCVSGFMLLASIFNKMISTAAAAATILLCAFGIGFGGNVIFALDVALMTAVSAAAILNIFTTDIKAVRTPYGKKLYDRLMGFERFMLTNDKYKLKKLCEQDSEYLYKMLPYTQALEISLPRPKELEKEYLEAPPAWFELTNDTAAFNYFHMIYFYDTSAEDISYVPSGAASFDVTQIPSEILMGINKKQ
ncbi:MAG: DUF2207 domain-containing protein [Ruminococcus sp.]|nr:DUF2207 domain-containing protein [Ruminococcus sp.]